jgi:hypothetical protein
VKRSNLASLTLAIALSPCALAQDSTPDAPPAPPPIDIPDADAPAEVIESPETVPVEIEADTDALEGPAQLEALVISVSGRGGRWRAPDATEWQRVAVDDVMPVGSQIDTGLRGEVALRVGKNATLLIDSASSVRLATIEQSEGKLVTHAVLTKGAADFKVDQVGLENDFVVITPSSTLAVKGTTFRVVHGPMRGTQIEGARANRVNAIEVGYFDVRKQFNMSGRSQSSSATPSPAIAALGKTVAPPPSATPSSGSAANAQGSSAAETFRSQQAVNDETSTLNSLIQSFGSGIGGIPARNPQPNPGFSGSPSSGPSPSPGPTPSSPSPSSNSSGGKK